MKLSQVKNKYQGIASINTKMSCLQETFLKQDDNINIKNCYLLNYIHDSGCRTSGGASVLIRNNLPYSKVNIKANIQTVALKATLHKAVNICSMSTPPNDDINENELKKLVGPLPKPSEVLGRSQDGTRPWCLVQAITRHTCPDHIWVCETACLIRLTLHQVS